MTENMKAFLEKVNENDSLKTELKALEKERTDMEDIGHVADTINRKVIEIAEKYNFTLTAEDFIAEKTELSPEEIEAITGGEGDVSAQGGFCACFLGGYGGGLGLTGEGWCMCPLSGSGHDSTKDFYKGNLWCSCFVAGGGGTGPNG